MNHIFTIGGRKASQWVNWQFSGFTSHIVIQNHLYLPTDLFDFPKSPAPTLEKKFPSLCWNSTSVPVCHSFFPVDPWIYLAKLLKILPDNSNTRPSLCLILLTTSSLGQESQSLIFSRVLSLILCWTFCVKEQ